MVTGENKTIILESKDFNINLSERYHLSIRVSLDNFSFCILNTNNLKYEHVEEYWLNKKVELKNQELISIINNNQILKTNFSSLSVSYKDFPNTLIPYKIYDKNMNKDVLKLNTETNIEYILINDIKSQNTKSICNIPNKISQTIKTYFPAAKEVIEQKILINQYSKFNQKETTVYLNICKRKFIITVLNKNKLLLNNTFNYENNEDLLYYILFCFEQLNLCTETTEMILYGLITESDENFKTIYKYIRNVTFGERPKQFKYSKKIEEITEQKYFGLFSQVLCA